MTRLGLRTEAGGRFEKGLAPEQAMEAQAVATRLMLALTGARLVPGTIDVGGWVGSAPRPVTIRLRDARLAGLLGAAVDRSRSRAVLEALGFEAAERDDGLDVTVPHFRRQDITREADVIEEVARLVVLEELPATLSHNRTGRAGRLTTVQRLRRRALDALVGCGLYEAVGWSFTDDGIAERLGLPAGDPRRALVVLENPMSEDQSVMRPTLLGSLLDAARHNRARGQASLRLFEYGAIYLASPAGDAQAARHPGGERLPTEVHALAALVTGDVLAIKAVLEAVGAALRADLSVETDTEPFLHPGRAARVLAGGERVGWVGEVHPTVAARWDLDGVAAFEIDLDAVIAHADPSPRYRDLTSFPELRLDLAVVVADEVPAARVVELIRQAGGEHLARVEVFDVYTGEQVGAGRKSLALHLGFRAPDRTLADEDVAPLRAEIVARLGHELGGELRG
jgi:phenylalanyl-tRNA synthetase beta chain